MARRHALIRSRFGFALSCALPKPQPRRDPCETADTERPALSSPPPSSRPAATTPASRPRGRLREWLLYHLADRRKRRSLVYAAVSLLLIGIVAAIKGAIGYYVFASAKESLYLALAVVAVVAGVFALFERRIDRALTARFGRTAVHRQAALSDLADELSVIEDRAELQRELVTNLDALLETSGATLYLRGSDRVYARVETTDASAREAIGDDDPAVVQMRRSHSHAPIAPIAVGSAITTPLVWPMRIRGQLVGFLAGGARDHIESFDAAELASVSALAETVGATLALIEPSLLGGAAGAGPHHNLPQQLTRFVGHEAELSECRRLLGEARLLTLIGIGGTGKTRLALRLAETVLDAYPDGVRLVELDAVSDPQRVASVVADALGIHDADDERLVESIAARLASRRMLLVLDGCERARTQCAALVERLLESASGLAIVATGREHLGVPGERTFAVRTLALPPRSVDDPQAIEASEAVQLFLDRARLVVPEFAPGSADLAAIAEICRRLEGIPLAIEFAAARVKLLSVAQIRARLDDHLRLLESGGAAPTRHETLRASIQWSYDHLAPAQQQLLRRFAVFPEGGTLAAALAVHGEARDEFAVLDLMSGLVDQSLVQVERSGDGEVRYDLLQVVRQFALEKLAESGEEAAVRARQLAFGGT